MKSAKPLIIALGVVTVLLVLLGVVWGKQYYEDRYVGADYYARVPADFSAKPRMLLDMNGNVVGLEGVDYELTAFGADGQTRDLSFTVHEGIDYPRASMYLRITASPQLVTGWEVIEKTAVPADVLEQIGEG